MSSSQFRRGKRRFDDDESTFLKRDRHRRRLPPADFGSETFGLPEGDRWSTWDQSAPTERGPQPYPDWLVTELAAVDTELGILKTGKEADVFLLRRGVPGTDRSCLLAAKRYRAVRAPDVPARQRVPRRPARPGVEGEPGDRGAVRGGPGDDLDPVGERRVRRAEPALRGPACQCRTRCRYSDRAAAGVHRRAGRHGRAAAGRDQAGRGRARQPVGPAGRCPLRAWPGSATRTATCRPTTCWCTGDRLVMIDMPQIVDVIANPRGAEFLTRDSANVARWFTARGLTGVTPGAGRPGRPAASRSTLALASPSAVS